MFSKSEEVNSKDFYTATFNSINGPLDKWCGHKKTCVVHMWLSCCFRTGAAAGESRGTKGSSYIVVSL